MKATGIVNAYVLAENEPRDDAHEVIVAPRIAAQHHQHVSKKTPQAAGPRSSGASTDRPTAALISILSQLFSLRVDPMIDGLNNQIVQVDAVPDSAPVGSSSNYYGNGFYNKKTLYKTTKEAVADYDGRSGRIWSIENPNKKNAYSGNNVGYKMGGSGNEGGKSDKESGS